MPLQTLQIPPCRSLPHPGASYMENWSDDNNMHLNRTKTKEMIFYFDEDHPAFPPVVKKGSETERAKKAKIMWVIIGGYLTWDSCIEMIEKMANKMLSAGLYWPSCCKKAKCNKSDLSMYTTLSRPITKY